MITVTGATGVTGRHILTALVRAGLPVRALIRSTSSAERLPDWVMGTGLVTTVVGDMLVPADAERALSGTDAVVHIGPAMHPREIAMSETVIDAAVANHVEHFVLMSVTHPQLEPLLNHQSKLAAERCLLMSRLPFTVLQPMHYMQDVDVARPAPDFVPKVRPAPVAGLGRLGNITPQSGAAPTMTVRATWNGALLAESDHTVLVEGNQYFPHEDVVAERFEPNETHTVCPWKGEASYYDVVVDGARNAGAAWYYPEPLPAASAIRDYVAFWKGVDVSGTNPGTPEVKPSFG